MALTQKCLAVLLSPLLALTAIPCDISAAQETASPSANQAASEEAYAPLDAEELDALVAPIALYPDALVAQVLGAATFPDQVLEADTWLKQNPTLKEKALTDAVDQQSWDPAVKALTQFPTVLNNLAQNLTWTSSLGEASAMQQQDVMAAIQRMRAKAYAAGNLKSGAEIKVVQESPQIIIIQPANPQVIYVPTYNPTVVYGTAVVTPGYNTSDVVAASIISFGVGIAVGAAISGSSCGWGWYGWSTNWGMGGVTYCRGPYYGNPYWWGGYYPGYRPPYPYPPRPPYPYPPGYRPPYPPGHLPPYPPGTRPPYPTPMPTPLPEVPGGKPTRPRQPGGPTTLPATPGGRPTTLPSNPTPSTRPATQPSVTPSQRPSTNEMRGYPRPSTPGTPAPSTRPSAFPASTSSTASRAQSARGNQSMRSTPAPRPSPQAAAPRRR